MAQICNQDTVSCNSSESIGLTPYELQRMDIAYDVRSSNFDEEKILVENGDFVGQTAVIKDNQVMPTGGNLPDG